MIDCSFLSEGVLQLYVFSDCGLCRSAGEGVWGGVTSSGRLDARQAALHLLAEFPSVTTRAVDPDPHGSGPDAGEKKFKE